MTAPTADRRPEGIRFGLTILSVTAGELVGQRVDALIVAGNTRGLLGAGPAGSLRSAAGAEPEREARVSAPHELGSAFMTGSGDLAERGIVNLLHAVVSVGLGEPPRPAAVPTALAAALRLSRVARHHSLALPFVGVGSSAPVDERLEAAEIVVETLVTHLRSPGSRLERVVFVSRFEDDLAQLVSLVARARERLWTNPV